MAGTAVAYVVSPHGFGHAARSCAVMEALGRRRRDLCFHIFTTVPAWFFVRSLQVPFAVHPQEVDLGLVQRTPLEADLEETVRRLDRLLAPDAGIVEELARDLGRLGCRAVVCDIAPLGLAAARRAAIPSVLVENFTWDWIYESLGAACPALAEHGRALAALFAAADLRLQAEPACLRVVGARQVPPISRRPRRAAIEVRERLGVPPATLLVLVSMGGGGWRISSWQPLCDLPAVRVVVAGVGDELRREGSLITLPQDSELYHPDLVAASDLVVGKLGYSTVAEAYHAGVGLAYVARPSFPESEVLARFVRAEMNAVEVAVDQLAGEEWLWAIDAAAGRNRRAERLPNGADDAAAAIATLLDASP